MSLLMKALTGVLHTLPNSFTSVETIRERTKSRGVDAPISASLTRRCTAEHSEVDGMAVVTLTPKQNPTDTKVLYLHGGAYVNPIIGPHWGIINTLIARTGATVTVASYPLAPEHTAENTFPKIRALYSQLSAPGKPVVIAGDSAGAGLALSLAIQLRDAGTVAPEALLLFSPWVDVTMTNPLIPTLERKDPMLGAPGLAWCGQQWAGTLRTTDPRISPVYDTLNDLPAMFIYQGGHDIFLPDAKRFTTKANAAGSPTQLRIYRDGFHVFVGATFTREGRRALTHAASVISAARR